MPQVPPVSRCVLWLITLSLAVSAGLAAGQDAFDFEAWASSPAGAAVDVRAWRDANPGPYRSYFNGTDPEIAEKWFIGLGPLGLTTRMVDRTWAAYPAFRERVPAGLADAAGDQVLNALEVVRVRPGSPCDGLVEPGDYLLAIDGQPIRGAGAVYLGQTIDQRPVRGLEMGAGRLLDAAQGNGAARLTLYRPAGNARPIELPWETVATFEPVDGTVTLRHRFEAEGQFRITGGGRLRRVELHSEHASGVVIPSVMAVRRGAEQPHTLCDALGPEWELVGTMQANQPVALEYRPNLNGLTESLAAQVRRVDVTLAHVGAFGDRFDPHGEKQQHLAAMIAHRLAVQQGEDGAWRAGGYASVKFPTAIAGLALLAHGDPQHDDAIRRAAHFVADSPETSDWCYPAGVRLLFLAEYYLATGDPTIRAGLRRQLADIRRFVTPDFVAGHKAHSVGYGGGGYIGAGGPIACALAVACRSDLADADDRALFEGMMQRLEEIAPHGYVPYGRTTRNDHAANQGPNQSNGCAAGGYYLASIIGGRAPNFRQHAEARYGNGPFGTAENGHAAQTLHFFWSSLASSVTSSEARQGFMDAYLWKFTTLIDHDGFVNQNNYAVEYHGGDGVLGAPYWRTAAYLILLSTEKQTLAITGNREHWSAPPTSDTILHAGDAGDATLRNFIHRNWALAEAALADDAPEELADALDALRAIPRGPDARQAIVTHFTEQAPTLARAILAGPDPSRELSKEQLAQMVLGLQIGAWLAPATDGDEPQPNTLHLKPHVPVLGDALRNADPAIDWPVTDVQVRVYGRLPGGEAVDFTHAGTEPGAYPLPSAATEPNATLFAQVRCSVAGLPLAFRCELPLDRARPARNYEPALIRIPVTVTAAIDDLGSYGMSLELPTGRVVSAEARLEGNQRDGVFEPGIVLRGGRYRVELAPTNQAWALGLSECRELDASRRTAAYTGPRELIDDDPTTTVRLEPRETLELTFRRPVEVYGVEATWNRGRKALAIEARVDGEWRRVAVMGFSGAVFTERVTADRLRLVSGDDGGSGRVDLQRVRVLTPPTDSPRHDAAWWP